MWISSKNAHTSGNKYYLDTKASHIDSIQGYISVYYVQNTINVQLIWINYQYFDPTYTSYFTCRYVKCQDN